MQIRHNVAIATALKEPNAIKEAKWIASLML